MIVNPSKFQAIILDKHKGNHTNRTNKTNRTLSINQKVIIAVAKVKLLAMEVDDKLFSLYINNICKSA